MENNVTVDMIFNGKTQGEVANYLHSQGRLDFGRKRPFWDDRTGKSYITSYTGGDPKKPESYQTREIQVDATLRRDEWKALDSAVMDVHVSRLVGIQDLISKGLVYKLGNAMGTTVLRWDDISDFGEAQMTMDGINRGRNDRPNYQTNYLPIPIISMDYEINMRYLEESRRMGNGMDVTSAQKATRKVGEYLESLLFTNTSYAFGEKDDRSRNKIYSYINFPDRNIMSLGTHWDDYDFDSTGSAGAMSIVEQVQEAKQMLINKHFYGPYMLYVPTNYETTMDKDYSIERGITIRERILKISGIQDVKVIDTLPADNVLLVQMTSDVVRLVQGMGIQNIQWKEEGDFVNKFKVITIQVPQIRSDQEGQCGILHLS